MSPFHIYAGTALLLVVIAGHALAARRNLLRKILALNVMGSGVFLFLVALAIRDPEAPPDPLPHAMVLTGIVVAVSATALSVALARKIHAATGWVSLSDEEGLE